MLTAKAPGVVVLPGSDARRRTDGSCARRLVDQPEQRADLGRRRRSHRDRQPDAPARHALLAIEQSQPRRDRGHRDREGPSAATLYGTDAANGVVVVTTKKGRAGASRWSFGGEYGNVDDRNELSGHVRELGPHARQSDETGSLPARDDGAAGNDADVERHSASRTASRTTTSSPTRRERSFTSGNRKAASAQVSGGSDAVRYFASGELNNEVGPIQMPGLRGRTLPLAEHQGARRVVPPARAAAGVLPHESRRRP